MDRPSKTLPSFPRKVSGVGGPRGRFCSGGCLWGLPGQFCQEQKDLAVGLPTGDTNTLGVDNSPPAPSYPHLPAAPDWQPAGLRTRVASPV